MMKINILFFIIMASFSLYPQESFDIKYDARSVSNAYRAYRFRNYPKAIELFENEIKHSPVIMIDYFETLADSYMAIKDYSNMLRVSREGIIVNQSSSKLYFQKGYSLYKLKLTNEAIEAIERSLILNPTSAYMNNFVGLLYLYSEDYKQAESSFLKATIYSPTNIVYLVNLGAAYERDRNYIDALQIYETAYRINPNYRGLKNSIIRARSVVGGATNDIKPSKQDLDTIEEQQQVSIENHTVSQTNN